MAESIPLVSIVMATYNRANSIKRAIESALAQSYENLELIIVDDGSTDHTKSVVEPCLKDPRVRYFYKENQGSNVYPMNRGVEISGGKYVAILDDDDIWSDKDKIKKQVEFLEKNKEYVLVGGGAIKIDRNGKEIVRYLMPEKDKDIRQKILISSMFVHVSVLFKKDAFVEVGGYDEQFGGAADWDLWMKLGRIGKFYNIPEYLVTYTAHRADSLGYVEKNHKKLEWLKININLKKKYSKNYPHYIRGLIFCWLGYFYSLLPIKRILWPFMFKMRSKIFGDFKSNG
jgi:glycosyltransferase involved in cell wall biosynthesis